MKPTLTPRKLQLNKQAVSNLSNFQMKAINGGGKEMTTSIQGCSGCNATCCDAAVEPTTGTFSATATVTIITILPGTLL